MFDQRDNYTLYTNETDLRVLEFSDPSSMKAAIEKDGTVIKLMRYVDEERKQ